MLGCALMYAYAALPNEHHRTTNYQNTWITIESYSQLNTDLGSYMVELPLPFHNGYNRQGDT
jgi:hypothetical protein